MLHQLNLSDFGPQCIRLLKILGESFHFFKTHKLWKGIFEHKWILLLTIILSTLFTFTLFSDLYDFIFSSQELEKVGLELGETGLEYDLEDSKSTSEGAKDTAIFGGSKFLMLILFEIVIFYFSVKTLEILNNEKYKTTFGMFLKAEFRMFKVLVRGFIFSLVALVVLEIAMYFIGANYLVPALMFFVHAYIIGLAFFDNCNEQQKLNIKESNICIRHHSGAATMLGVVASLGLLVPFVGALIVPVLGAITANIYGFRYNIDNPLQYKVEEVIEVEEV